MRHSVANRVSGDWFPDSTTRLPDFIKRCSDIVNAVVIPETPSYEHGNVAADRGRTELVQEILWEGFVAVIPTARQP